jgi:dGTPase
MAAAKLVEESDFEHPLLRFRIRLVGDYERLLNRLKKLSFHLAIDKAEVQQLERRGKLVVANIFQALHDSPDHLIPAWNDYNSSCATERRICDYVAGMTDSYAERVYRRLFVPGIGSSRDEL